jgi:hypothetical protein
VEIINWFVVIALQSKVFMHNLYLMNNAKIVSKQEIVLVYKLKAKSDLGTHYRKMLFILGG